MQGNIIDDIDNDNDMDPGSLDAVEMAEEPWELTPPPPPVDDVPDDGEDNARIEDLRISQRFIEALRNATLNNDSLHPDTLHQLRHPPQGQVDFEGEPDLCLAVDLFLENGNTAYTKI
jgi:hypothetical protein